MANIFEAEDGEFCVLLNAERQYSLWPTFREVPKGWTVTRPRASRQECLDWINSQWTGSGPESRGAHLSA